MPNISTRWLRVYAVSVLHFAQPHTNTHTHMAHRHKWRMEANDPLGKFSDRRNHFTLDISSSARKLCWNKIKLNSDIWNGPSVQRAHRYVVGSEKWTNLRQEIIECSCLHSMSVWTARVIEYRGMGIRHKHSQAVNQNWARCSFQQLGRKKEKRKTLMKSMKKDWMWEGDSVAPAALNSF